MEKIQISPDLVFYVAPENFKRKTALSQKDKILTLASKEGWDKIRVVGRGGMIYQIMNLNGWKVMSINNYRGIVPQKALDRIEILKSNGIKFSGILIADDQRSKPKPPEPIKTHQRTIRSPAVVYQQRSLVKPRPTSSRETDSALIEVFSTIAKLTWGLLKVIGNIFLFGLVITFVAFDPMVMVVLEDTGEWVCLYEWYE